MNKEQVGAAAQTIIACVLTWAGAKGWLDNDTLNMLLSVGGVVAAVVWGVRANSTVAQVNRLAAKPEVAAITTTCQELADAAPSGKVRAGC